jgi:predicted Abi (CAAX) family protease
MKRNRTGLLIGLGLLALLASVLIPALREPVLLAYLGLKKTFGFLVDLLGISLIAFIFGAFLAPLEALGWWAGWYGEGVEETETMGFVERPVQDGTPISRYIIYLDGIGQATYRYLPDVEEFLDRLEASLPKDMVLIRGILPYSVLNLPLTEDRPFAWLWRIADSFQVSRYGSLVGTLTSFLINLRNVLIVTVSADGRYGPIYNRGMAQVMYDSLVDHGYQPGSSTPLTLVGFSGGGQIALGALPFLKQSLQASIEVISIAGVISGNARVLQAEHLYHLVGDRDPVERLAPIFFPKRWKLFYLSNWNRAKRRAKISFFSLGAVGHSGAGGVMDSAKTLPDGRTHLQQTLDLVTQIITDAIPCPEDTLPRQLSNYDRYWEAEFNRPENYPIEQTVDADRYCPIAPWMGRLILPKLEQRLGNGVWFEVHHAPEEHQALVGQTIALRWSDDSQIQRYGRLVRRNIFFNQQAKYSSRQGVVHPTRLDRWRQVDPLESLAGARPNDDVIVLLRGVRVTESALLIDREPVQITGRYYALVSFQDPANQRLESDQFPVVHFNRATRQFDGATEIVCLPSVVADKEGIHNASNQAIDRSPLNATGWFIYGAKDRSGVFVVQAIAPRALLRLQPDAIVPGRKPAYRYLKQQSWNPTETPQGTTKSILLNPPPPHLPTSPPPLWQEGDRALVVHNYGGIGGPKGEAAAKGPAYFGHFAYGVARVFREPLSDELCFDIRYYQVYTQNADGLIAGVLHWSRYLGDRQFGWAGVRPTCDLLIKLDAFTEPFLMANKRLCALDGLLRQLSIMTARYRTGDGTGGTYVAAANNCSQDSNQALYATIRSLQFTVATDLDLQADLNHEPGQRDRLKQLVKLGQLLKRELLPFGAARADWQQNSEVLGLSLEDDPLENLFRGLASWRTIFPRVASDTIAHSFLRQGATIWMLRTSQIGGSDPTIAPVAPTTLPG